MIGKNKVALGLSLGLALILSSCSTKYETVSNKDISVKIRSIWADVDYDSRLCPGLEELKELESLEAGNIEALVPLEELKDGTNSVE